MKNRHRVHYELEADGSYRIDQYDQAPAFSSFLPGIGGPDGIPLWCMYVNRAQAVVSFGIHNKDNAIAEFLPATWAYQLVGLQGFRTFCKIDGTYYEPFSDDPAGSTSCSRAMRIRAESLELQETNTTHGLSFRVEYFSPVNRPIGALVRVLTIGNVSSSPKELVALDGLAVILPAGFTDQGLKTMRHIHEAYASVRLTCGRVPFYAAKVVAHDEPEVTRLTRGSFYAAWTSRHGELEVVEPFVDPGVVFGAGRNLVTPRRFIAQDRLDRAAQLWENRLPCALAPLQAPLEPGESVRLVALTGCAPDERMLAAFLGGFTDLQDIETALSETRGLIDSVASPAFATSALPVLDGYVRQNYLDNVLRGGVPLLLPSRTGPIPLHLYSRRHGDLERDYNYFVLPPTPLSSGPGNYRDVCQNRRCDIWFYPEVGGHEIRTFVELLQGDGYNPLTIEGYRWTLDRRLDPLAFCPTDDVEARVSFQAILRTGFQPGELLDWANRYDAPVKDRAKWLTQVLEHCDCELVAHGHEGGYWVDHWTYIVDLLEQFAAIYPDRVEELLFGSGPIGWFDGGAYVVPRSEKYVMRAAGPLQLNAVIDTPAARTPPPPVTVFGKLCALLAVKGVSFDHACKGIEMEAARPGWNDALNGLPGLFGSSTCEAAEVARLARWLQEHASAFPDTTFPVEVADLIDDVMNDLATAEYSWDRCATIREKYRERIRRGASGQTRTVRCSELEQLLTEIEAHACRAVQRSADSKTGLLHTYYINTPVGSALQDVADGRSTRPTAHAIREFVQEPLPLFLEGQVHWLRLLTRREEARAVYERVRQSPLFDASLQMYKLNECLDDCPPEIGRARTFTRGWFENESVWLHMSYKYLLELLRAGLHEEFFADAKTMLVPFMNPEVYGRSVLENSSFLASSANPDKSTHGRGFIARLSGSTAEFIHMWLLLTVGQQPFFQKDGQLHFRLRPVLPGEWFTQRRSTKPWRGENVEIPGNSFACALLGTVLLVYHNASRKDTFGPSAVAPVRYMLDGREEVAESQVGPSIADRIRRRACRRLDVWLG